MRIAPVLASMAVAALLLSQMIGFNAFLLARPDRVVLYRTGALVGVLSQQLRRAVELPSDGHATFAFALNDLDADGRVAQAAAPSPNDSRPPPGPLRALAAGLRRELGPAIQDVLIRPSRGGPFGMPSDPGLRGPPTPMGIPAPLLEPPDDKLLDLEMPLHDGFVAFVKLADGSWLELSVESRAHRRRQLLGIVAGLAAGALLVGAVAWWARQWFVRPLQSLATAADQIGRDAGGVHVVTTGPWEVRRIADALNAMQARLKKMIDNRTLMVAALSHDLRTPLTRLRLRLERLEEGEVKQRALADLDEMRTMVTDTLSFVTETFREEAPTEFDLASLLHAIADDHADAGRDVSYVGPERLLMRGRPVGIRRAIDNLVNNATSYGDLARLTLVAEGGYALVRIADAGEGIPATDFERVFDAFYRRDASRNREMGGVGLGLTAARSIVRAHGGDVILENAPIHGLIATVRLPIRPPSGS